MSSRSIVVSLYRKGQKLFSRRYARLDTAIPRMPALIFEHRAEPKDVFVVSHAVTGLEIGTMKVRVGGFSYDGLLKELT